MAVRRKRAVKKSNGHPFLVLLFFIGLVVGSAYMTDRMTNAPTADNANQVMAIRHIFNDKEMQGLVPKEDQGTPESVKEKIKDIINKTVVVEAKADDEKKPKDAEVTKADGKTERMKEDPLTKMTTCLAFPLQRNTAASTFHLISQSFIST